MVVAVKGGYLIGRRYKIRAIRRENKTFTGVHILGRRHTIQLMLEWVNKTGYMIQLLI